MYTGNTIRTFRLYSIQNLNLRGDGLQEYNIHSSSVYIVVVPRLVTPALCHLHQSWKIGIPDGTTLA